MDMKGDVRLLPKTDCSVKHLKKGGSCVYDGMKKSEMPFEKNGDIRRKQAKIKVLKI